MYDLLGPSLERVVGPICPQLGAVVPVGYHIFLVSYSLSEKLGISKIHTWHGKPTIYWNSESSVHGQGCLGGHVQLSKSPKASTALGSWVFRFPILLVLGWVVEVHSLPLGRLSPRISTIRPVVVSIIARAGAGVS